MREGERPLVVAIVGKKNSGKTTLLVRVAAELRRRGLRVASVKHGHHEFEIDHPGRDSWRHVHEGGVEAVLLLSSRKIAMVMQTEAADPDVREMIARHFGGRDYDVVLVEGFKHGDLPKIEIHRRGVHARPVHDAGDAVAAARFLRLVTDDPAVEASCPLLALGADAADAPHVLATADVIEALIPRRQHDG
jgi:molybdopterin-guanine dinucleotide biosynthesis protein MobB